VHIPDGFINLPTAVGFGGASAGGVWYGIRRTAAILDDRRIPLAGLMAAFLFAAQMVNFPIASGTSGHLIGGVLAAVLVGPWLGVVAMTVVLVVQGLLFADGGLTALGLNIFNMALIGVLLGYALFRALLAFLPATRWAVMGAAAVAAWASVPLAALGFVFQYLLGGEGSIPVATVASAMIGIHLLIGVVEGLITALVVGAVLRTRPDLVQGAPTRALEAVHG
jgi:cobalt/nickel transport system permease protein